MTLYYSGISTCTKLREPNSVEGNFDSISKAASNLHPQATIKKEVQESLSSTQEIQYLVLRESESRPSPE